MKTTLVIKRPWKWRYLRLRMYWYEAVETHWQTRCLTPTFFYDKSKDLPDFQRNFQSSAMILENMSVIRVMLCLLGVSWIKVGQAFRPDHFFSRGQYSQNFIIQDWRTTTVSRFELWYFLYLKVVNMLCVNLQYWWKISVVIRCYKNVC